MHINDAKHLALGGNGQVNDLEHTSLGGVGALDDLQKEAYAPNTHINDGLYADAGGPPGHISDLLYDKWVGGGGAGDQYFDDVTLLVHCNGDNGSSVFVDSSNAGRPVNSFGNVQVDTSDKKYGTGSGLFDGNGDYLTCAYVIADFDWFLEDYTIEMWVKASSWAGWEEATNGSPVAIGRMDTTGAGNYWSFGPMNDGKVGFYYFSGSAQHIESVGVLATNDWHHIAMTHIQSSGEIKVWVNGINDGSGIRTGTPQSASKPLSIGSFAGVQITGRLDDIRITKGVARYTGNFTPPNKEFPDSS